VFSCFSAPPLRTTTIIMAIVRSGGLVSDSIRQPKLDKARR
jgi:hypothetical protein